MTDTDIQRIQVMIEAKLRDHVVNEEHSAMPERPCQYFQDHRKIFFWTISGITSAMLIGWGVLSGQCASVSSTCRTLETSTAASYQVLTVAIQDVKVRQAKTDSDLDYIKVALNDIKNDLKARHTGP